MNSYEEKLKQYLVDNSIPAEQLHFSQSCHTVQEAAQAVGANVDELVKNICFIDKDENLIVAVVKGEDRVDVNKIKNALEIAKPRPATPNEMLQKTGYPIGGIPSFGYEALFLLDPKVMEKDVVYSGGGSEHALVKISPTELIKANKAKIVDIKKESIGTN